MRGIFRLAGWGAAYVALLLIVPLALPPTTEPTFDAPSLVAGDLWDYDVSTAYQGGTLTGGRVTVNVSALETVGPTAWVTLSARGSGSVGSSFPLAGWTWDATNGEWSSLSWTCPQGRSWANLSAPVPVGFVYPVSSSRDVNATVSAVVSGPCATAGTDTFESAGGVQRELAPGGSNACTLYVCDQLRVFAFVDRVLIVGPAPSYPAVAAWTLRGVWDPAVSGYQALSVSPGWPFGDTPGTVNLTLSYADAPPDAAFPSSSTMYGESALLVVVLPVVAVVGEVLRVRTEARRAEEESEREVLSALSPDARKELEEEGSDAELENETGPRPPG